METGAQLVNKAGQTMKLTVDAIQNVARTISEVTGATQAQTGDIAQINAAVSQLDQMTQQNSALVDQSAAASESLRRQAHELAALISRFVLPDSRAAAPFVALQPHAPQLTWGPSRQPA